MNKTFNFLPVACPACKSKLQWDDNGTHIVCVSTTCSAQNSKGLLNFFTVLKVKHVSMGTINRLIEEGHTSIEAVLRLDEYEISQMDGLGKSKAKQIVKGLKEAVTDVELATIQKATNIFEGFGERKLKLFSDYVCPLMKPTEEDLLKIEGVAGVTAKTFADNYDEFWKFLQKNPMIRVKMPVKVVQGSINEDLNGVVFTGFRDSELEQQIIDKGGVMNSGVSKKTKILLCKDPDGKSNKLQAAREKGVKLMTKQTFIDTYMLEGGIMDI